MSEWRVVYLGDLYATDCWCGARADKGLSTMDGPEGCVDAVTRGRTFCDKHLSVYIPEPPEEGIE